MNEGKIYFYDENGEEIEIPFHGFRATTLLNSEPLLLKDEPIYSSLPEIIEAEITIKFTEEEWLAIPFEEFTGDVLDAQIIE